MKEMPEEEAKQLAFDVACEFFKDDQLCIRYDLDVRQLDHIRKQPAFLREVDEVKRLLHDDGSEFVILAKRYAKNSLETCNEISQDPTSSETARLNASKLIFNMARLNHQPAKTDGPAIGTLQIHTNLALNQSPTGAYALEAKPETGELIEGEVEYVEERLPSKHADLL